MASSLLFRVLSAEEVATIYEKCLDVLSKKGMEIDHPQALKMLDKAGAQVAFDAKRVRFPRDIVEAALKEVPQGFMLASRDERRDIVLPDSSGTFRVRNGSGAWRYLDLASNTCRDVTLDYVKEVAQFIDVLDGIDFCAFPSPSDVPTETADIHAMKAFLENTSKHLNVQPYSAESIKYLLELAQVLAGSTRLRDRPIVSLSPNAFTPLSLKNYDVEVIIQSVRLGVPIHCWSLPSAGGTSPITIAGTVLLMGIEILAMIVLSQIIEPGTPVIADPLPFTGDMSTGRSLNSSVEVALATAAAVQFIRDAYHVPTHTYGFGTDSPVTDGQSMIEVTLKGLMATLVGSELVSGAGTLDAVNQFSILQMIIDDTIVGLLRRVNKGVKVDDDTLAWKEIMDTNPGGHFMEQEHTLKHCREAFRTKLFVSQSWEIWNSEGSKDLYARAIERYSDIKNKLRPKQLPADVQKELDLIVRRADEQLVK